MHQKNFLKNTGAVLAGFAAVFILSVITDMVVEGLGIFPGQDHPEAYAQWMLFVALVYRSVFAVVGGYVTARMSQFTPMRNVCALGILGTIGGIAGIAAGWDLGNHWYPVALAVTAYPLVWYGGTLYKARKA